MAVKGLICNVQFPALVDPDHIHNELPSPGKYVPEFQATISDDVASKGEAKTVVVILIGWAGAEDKHLAKYSEIHAKRGLITVRCTVPFKVTFMDQSKFPKLAKEVVNKLKGHGLQDHPIFFHLFSNGGAIFYSYILREMASQQNDGTAFDLRGTIFDSGPIPQSLVAAYRACRAVFSSDSIPGLGYILSCVVILFMAACSLVYYVLLAWEFWMEGVRYIGSPIDTCLLVSSDWLNRICSLRNHSFIFLYSDCDKLTPSEKIQKVAKHLKDRGNKVSLVKFEGSEHVQHYRKYPKEYVSKISEFMNEVLRSYERPTMF